MPTIRILAASLLALACLAAPASAADPVMALGDVRAGMQCTGYSVVRGIDIAAFDVEILDIVEGEPAVGQPRLLVRVSGPAVDATGLGPGFSGSPIYCPDAQGTSRVAGAISEAVGEYGGKVVLATPIEAVLGTPVDAPSVLSPSVPSRPLAAPLTISGLSPRLARGVEAAARRSGRSVLAVPAGPLASFPVRALQPGSAMSVGLSSGDLQISAIGTVSYVDGPRVWAFGHPLDALGRRSLLLQDAYVYRVINNPVQGGEANSTYKLAAPGHTVGTITNDAFSGVAGRTDKLPPTVPVTVVARATDTERRSTTNVQAADEVAVDNPAGSSAVSLVGPLAVAQAVSTVLDSNPPRLVGSMCAQIRLRELPRPLRICNRYVTAASGGGFFGFGNAVASTAADDLGAALALIDAFEPAALHVRRVSAQLEVRRGSGMAELRDVSMPRRVSPGQRVRVRLLIQPRRAAAVRRTFTLRIPRSIRPGSQRLVFRGSKPDTEGGLDEFFFSSPAAGQAARGQAARGRAQAAQRAPKEELAMLAAEIAQISRYDGVTVRFRSTGETRPAYRDRRLRIEGRASARITVRRAARSR